MPTISLAKRLARRLAPESQTGRMTRLNHQTVIPRYQAKMGNRLDFFSVEGDICKQEAETGPCRASHPRFYYNSEAGECQQFIYGGCAGNSNNFQTKEDCEHKCQQPTVIVDDFPNSKDVFTFLFTYFERTSGFQLTLASSGPISDPAGWIKSGGILIFQSENANHSHGEDVTATPTTLLRRY